MKDYRLPENRLEGFLKYYYAILKSEDYDPFYYTFRYLDKRFELNIEQRFWYAYLYGVIYNGCTAWVVLNEFPDLENLDVGRLNEWENAHWMAMDYETDTRYKKGKLHQIVPDYLKTLAGRSQEEFFQSVCNDLDPRVNFRKLWNVVLEWKTFGRYCTYFYLETLKECCNLNIECDNLMLEDIAGSKSHRNGLLLTLGMDNWDMHKSNPRKVVHDAELIERLTGFGDRIMSMAKHQYPDVANKITYFTAETAWCAYKGFFRRRRYLGFYLDRDCGQIRSAEAAGWSGIDWSVFWDARRECLMPEMLCENKGHIGPSEQLKNRFMDTGEIVNLGLFFPDDIPDYPDRAPIMNLFSD